MLPLTWNRKLRQRTNESIDSKRIGTKYFELVVCMEHNICLKGFHDYSF